MKPEIVIEEREGRLCVDRGIQRMEIVPEYVDALRAYFLAERDEQLGRWRDPVDPDWVVYRNRSEDDGDGRAVYIFNERRRCRASTWEHLTRTPGKGSDDVANRYFAAHPPKRELPTALGAIVEGGDYRAHLTSIDSDGHWWTVLRNEDVIDDAIESAYLVGLHVGHDWKLVHEGKTDES